MFEFLKECDDFSIYDRAISCEKTIQDSSFIIMVRVYFEAAVKTIYYYENNVTQNEVERESFYNLLHNDDLINIISRKYKFNNIDMLNYMARMKGNKAVHSANSVQIDEKDKRNIVKGMYRIGRGIYEIKTGKKIKNITDEQVESLLHKPIDEDLVIEIEKKYGDEINRIKEELKASTDKNEKTNEELSQLQQEYDSMLDNLRITEIQLKEVSEKLESAKFENVPKEEYDEKCAQIQAKDAAINRYLGDISILKNRVEIAERNNNEDEVKKLNEKNTSLQIKLKQEREERERIESQLQSRAKEFYNRDEVEALQKRYNALFEDFKTLKVSFESVKSQLSFEQSKALEASEFDRLDDEERKNAPIKNKYSEIMAERSQISGRRNEILNQINELTPYTCPYCHQKLSAGKYNNWYCRNYKTSALCKTVKPSYSGNDRIIINRINALWDSYNSYASPLEQTDRKARDFLNANRNVLDKNAILYKLPKDQLDSIEDKRVEFSDYPISLLEESPVTYLFQSLSVPKKIFLNRKNLLIDNFSRFKVSFGNDLVQTQRIIETHEKTIYSLVLRLLNRGLVLRTSEDTLNMLTEKFGEEGFCKVNELVDYISYSNPMMHYDSEIEKNFAESYFPRIYGPSWASYVSSQIGFDALIPKNLDTLGNARADFLLYSKNPSRKPLVLELDGGEHESSKEYDLQRDRILRGNGYSVYRYSNGQVAVNDSQIEEELQEYINDQHDEYRTIEINAKLLLACKIQHQLAIAITKALEMGYIAPNTNLCIDVSTEYFSKEEKEYILDSAIVEVEKLISHFSTLYAVDFSFNLKNESSKRVAIHIGDGDSYTDGILIRDCFLNNDYLCKLEPFNNSVRIPENIDETTLSFFEKYIFDFDTFREGQAEALKRILSGKDSIVLLATGAGKSLIYQLASFLVPGMVVVISPLKSLINDQIRNLEIRNGITNAVSIISKNGDNPSKDRRVASSHMKHNATSLLYISPERMQIPEFRSDISEMLNVNNVFAVAIDEAHCVSEWGHDFRPAYLAIGKNARDIFEKDGRSPCVIALTGTASKNVLEDIQRTLNINDDEAIIWPESFNRSELHFSIVCCSGSEKTNNLSYMIRNDIPEYFGEGIEQFSARNNENTRAGIVFTPFTRGKNDQYTAQSVLLSLQSSIPEMHIDRYYSKTPEDWDASTWEAKIAVTAEQFRNNAINLLVATKAFGMGIDKENIRYTIHDGMPQSLESFYQEAGRAGRDRDHAECILLFSDDNPEVNSRLLNPQLNLEDLRKEYKSVKSTADDVKAQLFFHLSQYKGVEEENVTLQKILKRVIESRENKEEQCVISCGYSSHMYGGDDFTDEERGDNGKRIAQGIIRLINLGIVLDYKYDYREKEFNLQISAVSIEDVKSNFLKYVESFDIADRKSQEKNIQKLKESPDAYMEIAKQLVAYTYEKIETGRRRQLINMYELAKLVANKPSEEQDAEIRKQLNNYFATPSNDEDDPIHAISNAKNVRMPVAWNLFGIARGRESFNNKDKQKAENLAGRAIHELESSMGSRPDLIMVKIICQIVSGNYSPDAIAADITAIDRFSREKYHLSSAVITKAEGLMYNLALSQNPILFEEIIKGMAAYKKVGIRDMLGEVMCNEFVSNSNRDYIAMRYYEEAVMHLL